MTKDERAGGKIRVMLLGDGDSLEDIALLCLSRDKNVTREFIAYIAAYLTAEIRQLTDAPDVDEIENCIDIAIEAFEGGAR